MPEADRLLDLLLLEKAALLRWLQELETREAVIRKWVEQDETPPQGGEAVNEATKAAREAGIDCGLNGPNTTNCHFAHFATPEQTSAWEAGKRHGSDERARQLRRKAWTTAAGGSVSKDR